MAKDGLERKIAKYIEKQDKTNERLEKILIEERKLKAIMIEWLKDHHVRLGRHWDELVHRTMR